MIVTTTAIDGQPVTEYVGVVTGEAVLAANVFRDLFAGLRDIVGGFWDHRHLTADGLEHTFALNHLAPFLLTSLLLERLVASAPARAVTVSSGAQAQGSIDFDDLMGERMPATGRCACAPDQGCIRRSGRTPGAAAAYGLCRPCVEADVHRIWYSNHNSKDTTRCLS